MPTKDEFTSLLAATNQTWTNDYNGDNTGIDGVIFTDKTDSSKTLFFPACGVGEGDSPGMLFYWTKSLGQKLL